MHCSIWLHVINLCKRAALSRITSSNSWTIWRGLSGRGGSLRSTQCDILRTSSCAKSSNRVIKASLTISEHRRLKTLRFGRWALTSVEANLTSKHPLIFSSLKFLQLTEISSMMLGGCIKPGIVSDSRSFQLRIASQKAVFFILFPPGKISRFRFGHLWTIKSS